MRRMLSAALAATMMCGGVQATTVNWSFTSDTLIDPATMMFDVGAGQLTYNDTTDVVTAFSGSYMGRSLALVSFTTDPNNASAEINPNGGGIYTYRGVPNTGGANYSFDGLFHQTYSTNGYLVSAGTGTAETVYVLNVDRKNGVDEFNFFSINSNGSYRQDFGAFVTSPVSSAVPEPASWAMMVGGFGAIGAALRRRRIAVRFA